MRRVLPPAAPQRGARRRRHLLRLPRAATWSGRSPSSATPATPSSARYLPIVERRKDEPYTAEQQEFQEYRRGRYVEFNLLYDRGTVFGLKTGGRIETILMSLPPVVAVRLRLARGPGSREAELTEYWLKPRDWAGESV